MALKFESTKCIGCKLCQLACSAINEEIFNPSLARLSVESYYKDVNLIVESKLCTLCGECSNSCPTAAITMLENRLSFVATDCINCGACLDACPENVIIQKEDSVGVCDLCEGDPCCVKACPHGALGYEEVSADEKEANEFVGLPK